MDEFTYIFFLLLRLFFFRSNRKFFYRNYGYQLFEFSSLGIKRTKRLLKSYIFYIVAKLYEQFAQ